MIDARQRSTTIDSGPSPAGYVTRREFVAVDLLTPTLVPEFTVRLADLDIEDEPPSHSVGCFDP